METGIHELTSGYALDALDAEERRVYEAHLPDCERCRTELASLSSVTEALAVGASGPVPSAELRGRILAGAHAEPQVVVPFQPRRRRAVPAISAVAAVAAIVAV
jgi:anti-sigma factor RsiW